MPVRRGRPVVHHWKIMDELISDVLQWIPTYGHPSVSRSTKTNIHQLCRQWIPSRWLTERERESMEFMLCCALLGRRHSKECLGKQLLIWIPDKFTQRYHKLSVKIYSHPENQNYKQTQIPVDIFGNSEKHISSDHRYTLSLVIPT